MTNEDDTETTDTGSSLSTFERWIRLYVPQNEDDSAEFLPADVATDLALADNEEAVTGVELTVDGVTSAAEMSTFLEAFDDRDVRIEKLVVEIELLPASPSDSIGSCSCPLLPTRFRAKFVATRLRERCSHFARSAPWVRRRAVKRPASSEGTD